MSLVTTIMELRSYRSQDQSQIEAIQQESQQDIDPNVPQGFFDDLVTIEESFSDGAFLVLEHQGSVVGFGGLKSDGEVVRMRVSSQFRRRGFASTILAGLIDKAKELNLSEVYLHTLQEQEAAQSLYQSYGFSESGRGHLHGNEVVQYKYTVGSDT